MTDTPEAAALHPDDDPAKMPPVQLDRMLDRVVYKCFPVGSRVRVRNDGDHFRHFSGQTGTVKSSTETSAYVALDSFVERGDPDPFRFNDEELEPLRESASDEDAPAPYIAALDFVEPLKKLGYTLDYGVYRKTIQTAWKDSPHAGQVRIQVNKMPNTEGMLAYVSLAYASAGEYNNFLGFWVEYIDVVDTVMQFERLVAEPAVVDLSSYVGVVSAFRPPDSCTPPDALYALFGECLRESSDPDAPDVYINRLKEEATVIEAFRRKGWRMSRKPSAGRPYYEMFWIPDSVSEVSFDLHLHPQADGTWKVTASGTRETHEHADTLIQCEPFEISDDWLLDPAGDLDFDIGTVMTEIRRYASARLTNESVASDIPNDDVPSDSYIMGTLDPVALMQSYGWEQAKSAGDSYERFTKYIPMPMAYTLGFATFDALKVSIGIETRYDNRCQDVSLYFSNKADHNIPVHSWNLMHQLRKEPVEWEGDDVGDYDVVYNLRRFIQGLPQALERVVWPEKATSALRASALVAQAIRELISELNADSHRALEKRVQESDGEDDPMNYVNELGTVAHSCLANHMQPREVTKWPDAVSKGWSREVQLVHPIAIPHTRRWAATAVGTVPSMRVIVIYSTYSSKRHGSSHRLSLALVCNSTKDNSWCMWNTYHDYATEDQAARALQQALKTLLNLLDDSHEELSIPGLRQVLDQGVSLDIKSRRFTESVENEDDPKHYVSRLAPKEPDVHMALTTKWRTVSAGGTELGYYCPPGVNGSTDQEAATMWMAIAVTQVDTTPDTYFNTEQECLDFIKRESGYGNPLKLESVEDEDAPELTINSQPAFRFVRLANDNFTQAWRVAIDVPGSDNKLRLIGFVSEYTLAPGWFVSGIFGLDDRELAAAGFGFGADVGKTFKTKEEAALTLWLAWKRHRHGGSATIDSVAVYRELE